MNLRSPKTMTTALAAALALSLTACSDEDSDGASPAPSASVTAPDTAGGGSYTDTQEIFTALNEAGVPCEEPMEGEFPGVSEAQACILDGSEDVSLLLFATPAERDDYLANREELASAVVGENWAVQTVLRETADRVAAALGGEVVGPPA